MEQKISIDQAKKILSEKAKNMTYQQIQSILNFLYPLCEKSIDSIIRNLKVSSEKQSL